MSHLTKIKYLTGANFSEIVSSSDHLHLIMFTADWSAMSHVFQTTLSEILDLFYPHLDVYCIDIDANQSITMSYGIRKIPTLLIFNQGKLVDKIDGVISTKKLTSKIQTYI